MAAYRFHVACDGIAGSVEPFCPSKASEEFVNTARAMPSGWPGSRPPAEPQLSMTGA